VEHKEKLRSASEGDECLQWGWPCGAPSRYAPQRGLYQSYTARPLEAPLFSLAETDPPWSSLALPRGLGGGCTVGAASEDAGEEAPVAASWLSASGACRGQARKKKGTGGGGDEL